MEKEKLNEFLKLAFSKIHFWLIVYYKNLIRIEEFVDEETFDKIMVSLKEEKYPVTSAIALKVEIENKGDLFKEILSAIKISHIVNTPILNIFSLLESYSLTNEERNKIDFLNETYTMLIDFIDEVKKDKKLRLDERQILKWLKNSQSVRWSNYEDQLKKTLEEIEKLHRVERKRSRTPDYEEMIMKSFREGTEEMYGF